MLFLSKNRLFHSNYGLFTVKPLRAGGLTDKKPAVSPLYPSNGGKPLDVRRGKFCRIECLRWFCFEKKVVSLYPFY
ncbi:MAG TPA: hypothetical protein DDZ96_02790 [Porphyromonadaceae bacterium]|nr:hypothetical protein [Porphyromonadaceae bacterium]HBL32733.1 hypothetical protein [Porphyromonadaceae bacterium]HCM21499.1 hypothetical protein [Porphyromonadaceae bacterium]